MTRLISDEAWASLTIWCEARSEPYEGQVAVAEVIQARMRRRFLSDGTVVGTVLAPYQFSAWNTTDPNRRRAAVLDDADVGLAMARQAWRDVLAGASVVPGALMYLNPQAVTRMPEWAIPEKFLRAIGAHHFYMA